MGKEERIMVTVKEPTTLVGISELRTKADEILKQMEHSVVIIERRHKAVAVMLSVAKYEEMEALLELISDHLLVAEAKARYHRTPRKDYLSLETLERRAGLR